MPAVVIFSPVIYFFYSVIIFTFLVSCRRFLYPSLHVALLFPFFVVFFSTVLCKCRCNVSSVLFFLCLFLFLCFSCIFIHFLLGPFLDLLCACPRSAADPRMIPRFANHTGSSHTSRAAFWERSQVLCQVMSSGAACHRYESYLTQMSHLTLPLQMGV